MIRQLPEDQLRYGEVSEASEFIYDRPFQWGSKRTGPDLQKVGGKYPDSWHYRHMYDPREVVPGSIMPEYKWLFKKKMKLDALSKKMNVPIILDMVISQKVCFCQKPLLFYS